jgi:hypothetical protein
MHAHASRRTNKDTARAKQAMSSGFRDRADRQPWVACSAGRARRRDGTSGLPAARLPLVQRGTLDANGGWLAVAGQH